jgi:hypothetical protein
MLDLDGTVYHWERTARYLLRRWYRDHGYPHPDGLDQVSTYYDHIRDVLTPDPYGTTAWRWLWDVDGGIKEGLFRGGHIYTGAAEAVHTLAKWGDVIVITKRPPAAVPDTIAWLAFQRWAISGVITLTGRDDLKSSVRPHCDVYIDDALDVLRDLSENTGGHVIAMDRPWNRAIAPGVQRAYDWDDALKFTKRALEERCGR